MTAPGAVPISAQGSPSASSNEPIVAKRRKRGEYNTLACQSCRRKKVKCPGGQVCAECQKSGETCVPPNGHRKQRKLNDTQGAGKLHDIRTALATAGCLNEDVADIPSDISACVRAVTARLTHLEAELAMSDAGVTRPSAERRGGQGTETVPLQGTTTQDGSLSHTRTVSEGSHSTVPAPSRDLDAHGGPPSGSGSMLPSPPNSSQVSYSVRMVDDAVTRDVAVSSAGDVRSAYPSSWHSLSKKGHQPHGETASSRTGSVMPPTHDSYSHTVVHLAERPEEVSPRSSNGNEGGDKRDSSSLVLLIEDLGRTVGHNVQSLPPPESEASISGSSPLACPAPRTGNTIGDNLTLAKIAVQDCNGIRFRASFDIFFQFINPHHPVLNELAIRQGFDRYLWDAIEPRMQPEDPEFLALLLLIHAETQLLAYNRRVSDPIPGWQEYETGDSILVHTMQSTRSSCVTIQCLILKCRYLLYLERLDSAYDTMGRAVRLCFQLKLHVRSSLSTVNDVEAVMRKRIFWCVVQLDGAISSTCGLPHQIRSSDFNLDMPAILDDRVLMVGRPLPVETPLTSSIPYLNEFIKCSSLHSEVWNDLFGVNAENPLSQSTLEALEGRVVALHHSLPDSLRWRSLDRLAPEMAYYAPFVCRQSLSLHLRSINMRLLLYQSQLMSLTFDEAAADHCLQLSVESIDSITEYYASSFQSADRYFCTMFLTAAIMPLSCIILKGGYAGNIQSAALDAFTAAMRLMDGMAPSFDPTRRMLLRFSGIRDAIGNLSRVQSTQPALGHGLFGNGDPIAGPLDAAVEQADTIPLVSVQDMSDLFGATNGKPSAASGWCDRMWDDLSLFGIGNSDSLLAPILSPMPL